MDHIPQDLVKSLMDLGLLESEAKIYVALVSHEQFRGQGIDRLCGHLEA